MHDLQGQAGQRGCQACNKRTVCTLDRLGGPSSPGSVTRGYVHQTCELRARICASEAGGCTARVFASVEGVSLLRYGQDNTIKKIICE